MNENAINKKEQVIEEVLTIVLNECGYSFRQITKEEVLNKRGDLVVQMTRAIFVTELMFLGYAKIIIAMYMGRSEQAIDDILYAAHQFRVKGDWTYRISEAECTKKCERYKDINT